MKYLLLGLLAIAPSVYAADDTPCTDNSVSVSDMAAGKCSCPAADPGVQIAAIFTWQGGQGQFTIPANASGVFNWFAARNCHRYGLFWTIDQKDPEKLVPVAKIPQSQWVLNMISLHVQDSLVKPLNKMCKEDEACKPNLPDLSAATEAKKAAEVAEAAAAAQAAAEALQPKQ